MRCYTTQDTSAKNSLKEGYGHAENENNGAIRHKASDRAGGNELGQRNTLMAAAGTIPSALQVKRALKLSWPRFTLTSINMMRGEERISLFQQTRMVWTAGRQQKAIYDGDTEEGGMYCGQGVGAIRDLPTVQELVDRVMAEAEQVIEATRAKVLQPAPL